MQPCQRTIACFQFLRGESFYDDKTHPADASLQSIFLQRLRCEESMVLSEGLFRNAGPLHGIRRAGGQGP